jgi:hypothetical protein
MSTCKQAIRRRKQMLGGNAHLPSNKRGKVPTASGFGIKKGKK